MTTSALTLAEFLLARIAEDETRAMPAWRNGELAPDRITRECEAKRRIVERATCDDAPDCGDHDCRVIDEDRHFLAAVYADHPDYRDEWRP